ncbi:restriction endonuclease subunit S [Mesotoga sp.]|uniref:restriction endonuclease subunit S n=1 Tax=Mesotoga sp. TaxID=2053577 RepID=UPI00345E187F
MGFRKVPFRDLLSSIVDNRGKTCPTSEKGIPLIATNCIRNDFLFPVHEKVRYVSYETHKTWFRGHPEPNDLVFVTKGTPGKVCMAPDPVRFCIAQDMVSLRIDREKVYPRFLFALLRSERVQKVIEQLHVGSLIPHFKKGDFDKLILEIPTNRTLQIFIGDFYYYVSYLIEVIRRINKTLEEIARAIFKHWFIDFEFPNENGEPYKSSGGEMIDSPLGPIPKGWRIGRIEDVCEFSYGKALKADKRIQGRIPVYGSNGQIGWHNERLVSGPGIIVGRKGNPGLIHWSEEDFFPIDTTFYVVPRVGKSIMHFLYFALKHADLPRLSADSAVPGLNRNIAYMQQLVIPTEQLLRDFENRISIIFDLLQTNSWQNQSLSELRDSLLPKLMSGEIRVPVSEKEVDQF